MSYYISNYLNNINYIYKSRRSPLRGTPLFDYFKTLKQKGAPFGGPLFLFLKHKAKRKGTLLGSNFCPDLYKRTFSMI